MFTSKRGKNIICIIVLAHFYIFANSTDAKKKREGSQEIVQIFFLLDFQSNPLGFCSLLEAGDAHFLK